MISPPEAELEEAASTSPPWSVLVAAQEAKKRPATTSTVSYTHLRAPRDATLSRMPSSA